MLCLAWAMSACPRWTVTEEQAAKHSARRLDVEPGLPGQLPARWHLVQGTQGCKGKVGFFLGRVEMPLLVNAME